MEPQKKRRCGALFGFVVMDGKYGLKMRSRCLRLKKIREVSGSKTLARCRKASAGKLNIVIRVI